MEQTLLQQLIDLVTTSAPELWRIARLQVLAINIQDGIFVVIFTALIILVLNIIARLRDRGDRHWDNEARDYVYNDEGSGFHYTDDLLAWKIVCWLVVIFSSIIIVCNVVSIVMRLVNPDYYAISVLVNLLKP